MRRGLTLAAVVLVATAGVWTGLERGNRLFRAGNYAEAVAEYRSVLERGEDSPVLRYNLGTALLKLGRYEEAEEHLTAALDAVDPELRPRAHYNLGQRFLEDARGAPDPRTAAGLYDAAVEAYRQALRLDPEDRDAKWNYELALQEREEAQQQAGGESEDQDESEDQGEQRGEGSQNPQPGSGEQERQPRPDPSGAQAPLTPEQAERILSGIEQDERELFRDKLRQGEQRTRVTRDW